MLLDAARDVLSMVEHGVSQTRQAAGLGRPRLRFVIPPRLPEALAVTTASALRSAAAAADVDWMDTPLDAEFSPVRQRQADAALGVFFSLSHLILADWRLVSGDVACAAVDGRRCLS